MTYYPPNTNLANSYLEQANLPQSMGSIGASYINGANAGQQFAGNQQKLALTQMQAQDQKRQSDMQNASGLIQLLTPMAKTAASKGQESLDQFMGQISSNPAISDSFKSIGVDPSNIKLIAGPQGIQGVKTKVQNNPQIQKWIFDHTGQRSVSPFVVMTANSAGDVTYEDATEQPTVQRIKGDKDQTITVNGNPLTIPANTAYDVTVEPGADGKPIYTSAKPNQSDVNQGYQTQRTEMNIQARQALEQVKSQFRLQLQQNKPFTSENLANLMKMYVNQGSTPEEAEVLSHDWVQRNVPKNLQAGNNPGGTTAPPNTINTQGKGGVAFNPNTLSPQQRRVYEFARKHPNDKNSRAILSKLGAI